MDRQFRKANVYDNSAITLNRNRIPGSMVRRKNNARKGKGAGWKGQMEVNWAEERQNHGESDIHSQVENENAGDGDYPDNWAGGGVRRAI